MVSVFKDIMGCLPCQVDCYTQDFDRKTDKQTEKLMTIQTRKSSRETNTKTKSWTNGPIHSLTVFSVEL